MKSLVFEIESNQEVWQLLDKNYDTLLFENFDPNAVIEWYMIDLKLKTMELNNIIVRNLTFDLQTNLKGGKDILCLNTQQEKIYQFNKPVANTLILKNVNEKVLKENGLQHIFTLDFEVLTIESFDENFLKKIKMEEKYKKRIDEYKKR